MLERMLRRKIGGLNFKMTIKKHDFIEIDYTGKMEEQVFDTTREKDAKEAGMTNPGFEYKPMIICVGENQVIKGVDARLEGKEIGKEYDFKVPPEEGFGKKDPKMLRMVPLRIFKEQNINPMPGLQVNIDSVVGIIKTVGGGRAIVDFNHPLSGRDVEYKVKINRIVSDTKEKLESYLKFFLGEVKVELNDGKAKAFVENELEEKVKENLKNKCKELIKVDVEFVKKAKVEEKPKEQEQLSKEEKKVSE